LEFIISHHHQRQSPGVIIIVNHHQPSSSSVVVVYAVHHLSLSVVVRRLPSKFLVVRRLALNVTELNFDYSLRMSFRVVMSLKFSHHSTLVVVSM